jgi:hypothetical protein
MATIGDKFDEVARTHDSELAGKICDKLRYRGLNYNQIADLAKKHGIDSDDWESMMYKSDLQSAL